MGNSEVSEGAEGIGLVETGLWKEENPKESGGRLCPCRPKLLETLCAVGEESCGKFCSACSSSSNSSST